MIIFFIKTLPPFLIAAPLATAMGLIVGVVGTLIWKHDRLRLQRGLIAFAFGITFTYRLYPIVGGLWYKLLAPSEDAAQDAKLIVGAFAALTIAMCMAVAALSRSRKVLAIGLLLAVYAASVVFLVPDLLPVNSPASR